MPHYHSVWANNGASDKLPGCILDLKGLHTQQNYIRYHVGDIADGVTRKVFIECLGLGKSRVVDFERRVLEGQQSAYPPAVPREEYGEGWNQDTAILFGNDCLDECTLYHFQML